MIELPPPALPARLKNLVLAAVIRHGLLRRAEALVLAGSLARQEGSWLPGATGIELLGDAEMLLVLNNHAHFPHPDSLAELVREVESGLQAAEVTARVELTPVRRQYLTALPPHLFGYELRETGQVLWGDPAILDVCPRFPHEDLPRADAWRLLANRIVELLPTAFAAREESAPTPAQAYPWVKLYLDMATSFLIFRRAYAPSYTARARRLEAESEALAAAGLSADFLPRVQNCTAWKLRPSSDTACLFGSRPDWAQTVQDVQALWCWELGRLTNCRSAASRAELWQRWLRQQSWGDRGRGWASAVRHCGWAGRAFWPRWARLARQASPRHCIYAAASELFFSLPELPPSGLPPALRAHYASQLPLPPPPLASSGSPTQLLLRQLALSFQLAHSTRA